MFRWAPAFRAVELHRSFGEPWQFYINEYMDTLLCCPLSITSSRGYHHWHTSLSSFWSLEECKMGSCHLSNRLEID